MSNESNQNGAGYMMGHSASEAERLDEQHVFFRHVVDGHLLSPSLDGAIRAGKIRRVLDVGTGTGIWCVDAAGEMKAANVPAPVEFVGADVAENVHWELYRTNPAGAQNSEEVYAKISFQVADLNDDVAMEQLAKQFGRFDLINSRMLISAIKAEGWPKYLARVFKLLRPGGYVQLFEVDMVNLHAGRSNDQTVTEALVATHAVYNGLGLEPRTGVNLAEWLFAGGFTRVRDTVNWCSPTVRQADGSLKTDENLYEWHATAYGVIKPLFFKFRESAGYPDFLKSLPPQAFDNLKDGRPETLLASEAEYDDFMRRNEAVLTSNPLYRTAFRTVIAQRPG